MPYPRAATAGTMRSPRVVAPFHVAYLAAGAALVAAALRWGGPLGDWVPWVAGGVLMGATAGLWGLPVVIEHRRASLTFPAAGIVLGFVAIVWLRQEAGLVVALGFVLAAMPLMDMMRRWWRSTHEMEGRTDV